MSVGELARAGGDPARLAISWRRCDQHDWVTAHSHARRTSGVASNSHSTARLTLLENLARPARACCSLKPISCSCCSLSAWLDMVAAVA